MAAADRQRYLSLGFLTLGLAIASLSLGCSDSSPGASDSSPGASDASPPPPPPPPPPCPVADAAPPETPTVQALRTATQIWSGVSKILVRDDVLYGNAEGVIWRRNGDATESIATPGIVTDFDVRGDTLVFLTKDEKIHRQKLDGTGLTTLVTFDGTKFARTGLFFHFDGDRLYFATQTNSPAAQNQVVSTSVSRGDGILEPVVGPTFSTIRGSQDALIDATHIYWNEPEDPSNKFVTVKRIAKGTAKIETVTEHLAGWVIQLVGDQMLVLGPSPYALPSLLSMPKAGGCPRFIVHAQGYVIADEREIYWYRMHFPLLLLERDLFRTTFDGGVNVQLLDEGTTGGSLFAAQLSASKVFLLSDNGTVWELDRF